MICRLRGIVRERTETSLVMDVHGVSYHVLVPPSIMAQLSERISAEGELELVTFHYQQLDVGRAYSVLIGFLNEVEREFFERFISVSGVGPKAALKAFAQPVPAIAKAIDEGDLGALKALPGIGEQRAKEIVAKLQGKVGKFALIQSREPSAPEAVNGRRGIEDEALSVLLQLEYKKHEAKDMIKAALARSSHVKTAEELLNEVYRQRAHEAAA